MAGRSMKFSCGIKRVRESSSELEDEEMEGKEAEKQAAEDDEPDLAPTPTTHLGQIIDLHRELACQAAETKFLQGRGFYSILSHALSGLCERFKGAQRLSRPYVAWELLEATNGNLSTLCDISVLETTSVLKPMFFEEPISSQAYAALNEILEFSDENTLFPHVCEWCETGRVADLGITGRKPQEPQPEKFEEEKKKGKGRKKPAKSAESPKRTELTLAALKASPDGSSSTGRSPALQSAGLGHRPRAHTGYTPERELPHAPGPRATGLATTAGTQTNASAQNSAPTSQAGPVRKAKRFRLASKQTDATLSVSHPASGDLAQPSPIVPAEQPPFSTQQHHHAIPRVEMSSRVTRSASRMQQNQWPQRLGGSESPRGVEEAVAEAQPSTAMEIDEAFEEREVGKEDENPSGEKAGDDDDDDETEKAGAAERVPYATFDSAGVFDDGALAALDPALLYNRELEHVNDMPYLGHEAALFYYSSADHAAGQPGDSDVEVSDEDDDDGSSDSDEYDDYGPSDDGDEDDHGYDLTAV